MGKYIGHMKMQMKMLTWWLLSITAKRFLATQTAVSPADLFESGESGFWESVSLGICKFKYFQNPCFLIKGNINSTYKED